MTPNAMGDQYVCRVAPLSNQYAAKASVVVAWVKDPPLSAKIDLHPTGEVHRRVRRRMADIAHIARAVSRGNVEAATKRDRQTHVRLRL